MQKGQVPTVLEILKEKREWTGPRRIEKGRGGRKPRTKVSVLASASSLNGMSRTLLRGEAGREPRLVEEHLNGER